MIPTLFPASGGAAIYPRSAKIIRFVRYGCTNRPFFHIVVMDKKKRQHEHVIEQLGTFDPIPNKFNEKLVSLNFERIQYWIGSGAVTSIPVEELLGLSGFFPIHPRIYMAAWRNRRAAQAAAEKVVAETAAANQQTVEAPITS